MHYLLDITYYIDWDSVDGIGTTNGVTKVAFKSGAVLEFDPLTLPVSRKWLESYMKQCTENFDSGDNSGNKQSPQSR